MGGYGALRLAFRHPQMFAAVSAHSAAFIENLPKAQDRWEWPQWRVLPSECHWTMFTWKSN